MDFPRHIVKDDIRITSGHWLHGEPCQVCLKGFTDKEPIALVAIGVEPKYQKESGYTNGVAIPIHTACAKGKSVDQTESDSSPESTSVPSAEGS